MLQTTSVPWVKIDVNIITEVNIKKNYKNIILIGQQASSNQKRNK